MKKIGLLIVMTLTVCLCACGSDSSTTKETGSGDTTPYTYEDITFKIPTAWGEPTEGEDAYYFYPEGKGEDGTYASKFFIITTDQDLPNVMSEKEIKSYFEEFNSELSDTYDIISSKIIKSFKCPCEYVKGTAVFNGESWYLETYAFIYNGKVYNVAISASDSNKNDYSSDLTNIVNSLEYDEDKNDESATEQSTSKEPEEEEVSQEFKNALKKAQSYSDMMYLSKKRIYKQLTSDAGEGFPEDAAKYAIKHVDADWNYNALKKAKTYYNDMAMSKDKVYDQLVSDAGEGFTAEQAQYAVDHLDD